MNYEMLYIDGEVLRPSPKAIKQHRIHEYWDFYLSDLSKTIDVEDMQNVSKPIFEIVCKITREKQIDFLLELISMVKKYDVKKQVNWKNTNRVVVESRLYFEFLRTDIVKKIDAKYFEDPNSLLRVSSMNDTIKHNEEINKAFEKWVKNKLIH